MNRSPIFRTLVFCLVLVMGLGAAHAQGGNLLTNPGFEQPYVALANGAPSRVAQGWTAWYSQDNDNMQPEYYPASDTFNGMTTPRIHSGNDAQQYFTFFAPHNAGVYQTVTGIAPGAQVTFSLYIYLWVSNGSDANPSDGSGAISAQVGIDPTGGTDPNGSAVVWSDPLSTTDQYVQNTVMTIASGDSVTVFARSAVSRVAMHNVVFLDDGELTAVGGSASAATSEVVAEVPTTVAVEVTPTTETVVAENPTTENAAAENPTAENATSATEPTTAPVEAQPTEVLSIEAPTQAPPTEVPTEEPPTFTPSPSSTLNSTVFPVMFTYVVQRGDTVGQLATRFGSTVEAIIIANQLDSDAHIFETQTLMIPVVTLPPPTEPATATPIPSETPISSATPLVSETLLPATEAPLVVAASETPQVVVVSETPQIAVVSETPVVPTQPGVPAVPATATIRYETYRVQYGDTLSTIAARFGIGTSTLAAANGIVNPNLIFVGELLRIPLRVTPVPSTAAVSVQVLPTATTPAQPLPTATATVTSIPPSSVPSAAAGTYQVMPGDNLYTISVRLGVPLADIIQANGIVDPTRLFVGQVLIIP